jgi:DNA ligase-associated metallophosphoesterase
VKGAAEQADHTVTIAGVALVADCSGALYWSEERLLVVADLHLEKGSSYAARGVFLPPYDTAATLGKLAHVLGQYVPRTVIALGDSFHDRRGASRLSDADRSLLGLMQRGREWIWIAGNHDPEPGVGIGGIAAATLAIGGITFRHEPRPSTLDHTDPEVGEIAGHLHPVAHVSTRARRISRRCFAADAHRIVMPAFGAYTGGVNVRNSAFADVFGSFAFTAHMLGAGRLYRIAADRCAGD